jgi:UDP-hydrolysing UDP-N-acetyl-D-glucosamine 2-epimerase
MGAAQMKRKITVITGTRADYGILKPVMERIRADRDLSLEVVATSMHLMKEFGYTLKQIKKDGFSVKGIDISYTKDSGEAMAASIGKAVGLLAKFLARSRPDIVVVLGDRGEMLAAALAANYLGIPVAHIHGGEVSGHVDGLLRHAISKLAHLHFTATKASQNRLLKMGEEPWRVQMVGAPALDQVLAGKVTPARTLRKKYNIQAKGPFILLAQHSVLTEVDLAAKQFKASLAAVKELSLRTIIIYPNADAGGRQVIKEIKKLKSDPLISAFKNVPHADYLGLLSEAAVLLGNSSSGLIEAPSFGLPVVNVGTRQAGRERGSNVIDVPQDSRSISKALKKAVFNNKFRNKARKTRNLYGDGKASQRIVKKLVSVKVNSELLQKQVTY